MQNLYRELALRKVDYAVDDTLAERTGEPVPDHARLVICSRHKENRLIVVAVWSYLPGGRISIGEAIDLAKDLLMEKTVYHSDTEWLEQTPVVL